MKKNIIVNKGSGGRNSMSLDLVEGGFLKNYGGMIAIGYKGGNKEYFLSATMADIKSFIREIESPMKAEYGNYDPEADCYFLNCPNCHQTIGSLDNEDADGTYKYNIYAKKCEARRFNIGRLQGLQLCFRNYGAGIK